MKPKNYIKKIREERGLSQEQLARKLNTTNPQISHLELGKRRLTWEWMIRIAEALECHPTDLVYGLSVSAASAPEQNLLNRFRSLTAQEQKTVQNMVNYLAESKGSFRTDGQPKPKKKRP